LFKRAYPGIQLRLDSAGSLIDLAARQADIAFENNPTPKHLVLWNSDRDIPDWAKQYFPEAKRSIQSADPTTMLACIQNHMGVARLPGYVGDNVADLRRLKFPLVPSTLALWVLSYVDLRATARVRACREFLIDIIEQQRDLVEGKKSLYFQRK
jgi:DNA-binding transcriptional LysR family regulator